MSEISYQEIKELVDDLKDSNQCEKCGTYPDDYYLVGVGSMCKCETEDFKENGKEKYTELYEHHIDMVNSLRKDAGLDKLESSN